QVAKKQDTKASDSAMKSESEKKDDSVKADKKEIAATSKGKDEKKTETPDTTDQAVKKDDAGKDNGQQKDSSSAVEEKEESSSLEVKEPDKKQEGSESVAKLTPSKTLTPVKIEPLTSDFEYKPEGKIDPFSSLFKVKEESRKKKRKRFPLTPLEKTDISQFKLVGVILSAKGNKAIVQEASGKGYVVSKGTYIGVNDGQVVEILKDKIICEEEVENLFGETEIKSRILKINKPPEAL
ncbi:MAG: pilus assembly protein PilP, partial [Desulfobacterales bacterium]|nr:pilus assembly protein PilP [Desulfobacterales bacterium]